MYTDLAGWILIVAASIFTLAAAFIDFRTHRIPNYLTIPAFFLGWIYQFAFHGWAGVGDGLKGFAIGFGMYFVLWLIGSGGGGDAKLAGAVSVWLGFQKTLGMIVVSTIFVILGTGFVMLYGMLTKGVYKTKNEMMPSSEPGKKPKKQLELLKINRGRKGMTFALSLALATVAVCLFMVPQWPYKRMAEANRAKVREAQEKKVESKPSKPAVDADETTEKPETDSKNS